MFLRFITTIGSLAIGLVAGWCLSRYQFPPAPPKAEAPPAETRSAVPAPAPETGSAGETVSEALEPLDWLVGDWCDNNASPTVEFSCNPSKNGKFLVRSFRIARKEAEPFSGMQLIAWDPAKGAIRSWTFDSAGGFGEETWTQSGNRYTIRSKYTLPDGGSGSSLQIMNYLDDDNLNWKSVSREIDGEIQPDTNEITLVRKTEAGDAKGGN